ncbi:general stress protein [Alkalicoccus daliensis]|uniref:Heat induced stress protein YflT n=1 Tax=Alkalicoccus daliensis TaxID=745820 RepID=A0A1H0E3C5_9BACI|nr:general stress protein [Alkalicoccus daliensis]SDN76934.1 Heat induced stress protein YflT [Alkalicoccus daliensis]
MKKRIVGVFDSEKEVAAAVEDLKLEGHRPEEISLIAEKGEKTEWLEQETNAKIETPEEGSQKDNEENLSFMDKVKMAFKGQTEFSGAETYEGNDPLDFKAHGFSEGEANEYEQAVKDGKVVVLAPQKTTDADKGITDSQGGEHQNEAGEDLPDNELADPLRPNQEGTASPSGKNNSEDPVREKEKSNTEDPENPGGPSQIGDPMSPEDPEEQAKESPKFPQDTDVDPEERARNKEKKPSDD